MADPTCDIEATGRCCCAGCIGMGPCDREEPDGDHDDGWCDCESYDCQGECCGVDNCSCTPQGPAEQAEG